MTFMKPRPIDIDYSDPVLLKDIELTPESQKLLERRAEGCFLCRWILEDYKQHGALKGYKAKGSMQEDVEIFPLRGEIDHLWLELHGKQYPFKEPLKAVEKTPQAVIEGVLVPVTPEVKAEVKPVTYSAPAKISLIGPTPAVPSQVAPPISPPAPPAGPSIPVSKPKR